MKLTYLLIALITIIGQSNAKADFLESEVFHLLKEDYKNYCTASNFTTDSVECKESRKDYLIDLEKITLVKEALLLKEKKIKEALKKNIFTKKCFANGRRNEYCGEIDSLLIRYIDVNKTLSELHRGYADECQTHDGVGSYIIDEECSEEMLPLIKHFNSISRQMEIQNPFLKNLKKKISKDMNTYVVDHGREYEAMIKDNVVIDDVYKSTLELEESLLKEFEKTKSNIDSNIASRLVNDSSSLNNDELVLLAELSSLYFNQISNPNVNPKLQHAKCQLQNKVLYEENVNDVSEFGVDVMLTIASFGYGSVFFTRGTSYVIKNQRLIPRLGLVMATVQSLEFELDRFKKVMVRCENLEQQLLVETAKYESVFHELKQCENEAMGYIISLSANAAAFSAPLAKSASKGKGVLQNPSSKQASGVAKSAPESVKKTSKVILSKITPPRPYELLKGGVKVQNIKIYQFTSNGRHVFLKTKDGSYYVARVLGADPQFPSNIDLKDVISYLGNTKTPFLNTHRSLLRKFNIDLEDVVSAGEVHVSGGKVLNINNKSGTFKHGTEVLDEVGEDFGIPSSRIIAVETSTQLKKHSKEHITAGLSKYFEGNPSYQKVQTLRQKTTELLDKKSISYADLQKELEDESESVLRKLISGEPGVSELDMENASNVQKAYNYLIYSEEPEVYFYNMLRRSGGDENEKLFQVYDNYLYSSGQLFDS
jgi:hypothetical protein